MTEDRTSGNSKRGMYTQGELDIKILKILTVLGIPANLKGFGYLRSAISAVYYDPQAGSHVVSGLYRQLALENHTTSVCVERAMRNALHRVRRVDNSDGLFACFGEDDGLTLKKFINSLAKKLREDSTVENNSEALTAK